MAKRCSISSVMQYGVETVYLENEWLRVGILTGRGTDIFDIIYKPLDMDVLMKTPEGLTGYVGRDLHQQRLSSYAELYPGGWQELLPNAVDLEGESPQGGCESATVPWNWEIVEESDDSAAIRCTVLLPLTPFYVEKNITINAGDPFLRITERVTNQGHRVAKFTWTHHPAYGGRILEGDTQILLPECKAFNIGAYLKTKDGNLIGYEEPMHAVTMPDGEKMNLWTIKPRHGAKEHFFTLKNAAGMAGICNRTLGVTLRMDWDAQTFPHIAYWARYDDVYTLAMEPARSYLVDGAESIRHGECITLKPGSSMDTWLNFGVYQNI